MKIFSDTGSFGSIELETADILTAAEEEAELSPSLSERIEESKRIFVVAGRGIRGDLLEAVLEKCGEKLYSTLVSDGNLFIDVKYADKMLDICQATIDDYRYFGVTNAKTPLLIHKVLTECDSVIVLADIGYDSLCGFSGVPGLIFPHLSATKSKNTFWRHALDLSTREKLSLCSLGVTFGNPLDKDIKEAVVSCSAGVSFFGINIVSVGLKTVDVFCGDPLLSYVHACEAYDKCNSFKIEKPMDGLILETYKTCLQGIVSDIEASVSGLIKGGRLLIKAPRMDCFGSSEFRGFFDIPGLEDIFDKVAETEFVKDTYDAFRLKKICSLYHLAVISPLEKQDIVQCGMNLVGEGGADEFLKNCSNTGKINNAARFTING